ncbi:hypothetical protein [Leucobacter soli]|uniref:hypothetical protein n=1 Tax=Leucobacter soli TaxID=2812850 RepID=UPI00360B5940
MREQALAERARAAEAAASEQESAAEPAVDAVPEADAEPEAVAEPESVADPEPDEEPEATQEATPLETDTVADDAVDRSADAAGGELESDAGEDTVEEGGEEPTSPVVDPLPADEFVDEPLEATQPFSLEDLRELDVESAGESGASGADAVVEAAADAAPATADASEPRDARDADAVVESAPDPRSAPAEEPAAEESAPAYSFPDITPLDDQVSVFDDPTVRTVGSSSPAGSPEENGDFDELISRAVAQESATTTTNASALILPNLPDTGDLSGPLGGTGELFVTGSISLPKSVGETGGHVPVSDVEADHLEEMGFDALPATSNPILPVSASRAVSAVSTSQSAAVEQETKEKSKLPLVLIVTGGGLVVAVGALLIWGASSGMFG